MSNTIYTSSSRIIDLLMNVSSLPRKYNCVYRSSYESRNDAERNLIYR